MPELDFIKRTAAFIDAAHHVLEVDPAAPIARHLTPIGGPERMEVVHDY